MTIKVFVSSISGNKEVKKQQQHVLFVLSSHNIDFIEIDIADPANEELKQKMLDNSKPNKKGIILPPQVFNDDEYCGDYDEFEIAIEDVQLHQYLKLAPPITKQETNENIQEVTQENTEVTEEGENVEETEIQEEQTGEEEVEETTENQQEETSDDVEELPQDGEGVEEEVMEEEDINEKEGQEELERDVEN